TPVDIHVLTNDTDVDSMTTFSITSATNGVKGTTSINDNGTVGDTSDDYIVYTPNLNQNGLDSFTYTMSDGAGGSSTATVNVTINPVSDSPIDNDDTVAAFINTDILINVLGNDTDPDGDNLFVDVDTLGSATNGTVQIILNRVLYTPGTGFLGSDQFTYFAKDSTGLLGDGATVFITVSDVP
ncbi:MAG: tandem-95 repeat protein, partial [Planctomycetales bacterium]|nr:tandem-95 repeat protein [Planctomycetales bacterium]